jgi:hypothetical protein
MCFRCSFALLKNHHYRHLWRRLIRFSVAFGAPVIQLGFERILIGSLPTWASTPLVKVHYLPLSSGYNPIFFMSSMLEVLNVDPDDIFLEERTMKSS